VGSGGEPSVRRFISGLVLDRALSPRERLGSSHVRQLAESIQAGATLPPIVVERETSRVVDGFHRVEAYRRLRGPEALVEVLEKDYEDEAALFEDAMRLNSAHGSRLAPYDQLRCVAIAERLYIDPSRVARALSVRASYVGELKARRMGTELSSRAAIPLKRTIEHMRGRALTREQMQANHKLGGQNQAFYVQQLIILLQNDLLDTEDEDLMARVGTLKALLSRVATPEPGG